MAVSLCSSVVLFSCSGANNSVASENSKLVENVSFTKEDNDVIINYNLRGSIGKEYNVVLLLKKVSDPNYQYVPQKVSGDVGTIQYSRSTKQIIWEITNELPGGLHGNDFYFVVEAQEISDNTGFLSLVGIGVAVVAAVVTYIIIAKQKPQGVTKTSFPDPPERP